MTKKAEKVRILHHHDRPYHVMAGLLTVLFTVAFLVSCTGSESPKQPVQQEVPSATADRGVSPAFGFRHFAQEELDPTQYRWEPEQVALLLRLDAAHP